MTTSLTLNDADTKEEIGENFTWHEYGLRQITSAPNSVSFDANYEVPGLPIVYSGKRTGGSHKSQDTPPFHRQTSPIELGEISNLNSFQSISCLKRSFSHIDSFPYRENLSGVKEEIPETPNPNISQGHCLLSFAKLPETHSLIDNQGDVQQIDLTAQLHGMFFLSEQSATPGESVQAKPELTCYRRNLFQISGSVTTPKGGLYYLRGSEKLSLLSMEVQISAIESVDGHNIRLIVIPWKTPPPNSPEPPVSLLDREPKPIPITAYKVTSDASREIACSPIAYRRLQFRVATANNGRRKELQQHFTLHLTVIGTLADGSHVNVCEASTAPIVVRGRSPRNFQSRKGIPLVGSSSSRGNPPELQIAMNLMASNALAENTVNQAVNKNSVDLSLELPRSEFTFDSNIIPGSPSIPSLVSYSSWKSSHSHHSAPTNYPPTPTALDMYIHPHTAVMDLSPTILSPNSVTSHTSRSQPHYNRCHPFTNPINLNQNPYLDSHQRSAKSPRCSELPNQSEQHSYLDLRRRFPQSLNPAAFTSSNQAEVYYSPTESINWMADIDRSSMYESTNP
ncbi:hypothetical protein EPUL_006050, partial [Erysiphe pulchra]